MDVRKTGLILAAAILVAAGLVASKSWLKARVTKNHANYPIPRRAEQPAEATCCYCQSAKTKENFLFSYGGDADCEQKGGQSRHCQKLVVKAEACRFHLIKMVRGKTECYLSKVYYTDETGRLQELLPPSQERYYCEDYTLGSMIRAEINTPVEAPTVSMQSIMADLPPAEDLYWTCGNDPNHSNSCRASVLASGLNTFSTFHERPRGTSDCDPETCSVLFGASLSAMAPTYFHNRF